MKYLLLFSIFAAMSCQDTTVTTKDTGHNWGGNDVEIIEFDSCEYVLFGNGTSASWGGHKGNCKNPVHK